VKEVASARTKEREWHNTARFLKCYLMPECLVFVSLFLRDELLAGKDAFILK